MDDKHREALGCARWHRSSAAIRGSKTRAQLATSWARRGGLRRQPVRRLHRHGSQDTARYAVYLSQSGLSLPDRDYYLDPEFAKEKAGLRDYAADC